MTGFVFPLLLNALLNNVGLRWTLRIWAIGTTVAAGIAFLGMRGRLPVPKYNAVHRRPKLVPNRLDYLGTTLFWSVVSTLLRSERGNGDQQYTDEQAITNMLQGLSYFPVSLYIATFAKGLSNQLTATTVLSLFNVSAVIGQIIIGHLSDVMPYPSVMPFSAIGSSLGAFLLWGFANKAVYLYFFAIIFGSLVSIFSPASQSIWSSRPVERRVLVDLDELRGRVRREQTGAYRFSMDRDIFHQGDLCRHWTDHLRVPFAGGQRDDDGSWLRQVRIRGGRTFCRLLCSRVWCWQPCHRPR